MFACSSEPEIAGEVLAKVGDRVITKEDFLRRAEYTLRPDFCAGDNYIHRKIVLNSLIAEKLLALESPRSPLLSDSDFMAYIQGRQEQSMRQWLYKVEGWDQVELDTTQYRRALRNSIRTYDLQFLTLPDSEALAGWERAMQDGYDFQTVATALTGSDTIPNHSMSWFERGDNALHEHVFGRDHAKGDVLDPLELEHGEFLVVKIAGWVDRPVISDQAATQNAKDVQERLSEMEAEGHYKQYVGRLMAGKRLDLNPEIFPEYAKRAADIYLRSTEEKEQLLNQAIWNAEEQVLAESITSAIQIPGDAPLFTVDGDLWTVDRFENMLKRHPLVFRKRKMTTAEFPKQMKLAIADMVRDHFLTQEAYDRDYDKLPNVRQATLIWQDHYVSRKTRNNWVRSQMDALQDTLTTDETQVLETYMNPLIDTLQTRYSDEIFINTDLFEQLKLSSVPMMVSQRNLPFPLAVPAFPRLTTDDLLNYGKKWEP